MSHSAKHIIKDLYGKIEAIIDGGEIEIGIESSIIDLTTRPTTLLRPSRITLEELRKILSKIMIHPLVKGTQIKKIIAQSPGMKYKHYAPDADIIVIKGEYQKIQKKIQEFIDKHKIERKFVGVMTTNENHIYKADVIKFLGNDFNTIAKNLFKTFREFDEEKVDIIIAKGIIDKELGHAIMNRLRKASDYNTIKI